MDISLFRATNSTVHVPHLGEVRLHAWRPGIYNQLLARQPKKALPRRTLRIALEVLIEGPKRPNEAHLVRLRSLNHGHREAIAQRLCHHCQLDDKRPSRRSWLLHFSVLLQRELRRHRKVRRAEARRFERRARELCRDPLERLMGSSALFRQFEQMERLTNPFRHLQLDSLEQLREATSAASALTEQARAAVNELPDQRLSRTAISHGYLGHVWTPPQSQCLKTDG
ncbi:MAG: hypothetical protein AAGA95_14695 [Pseudomonadota bacterium]